MSYPKSTKELVFFKVAVNKVNVTENVDVFVAMGNVEPDATAVWTTPELIDGTLCILIDGFETGSWHIWARTESNPETPVVDCGKFRVGLT